MGNNNGGGQVPDQRLEQIQAQLRQLQNENQQLRGTIDAVTRMQRPGQQQEPQQQQLFKPEIQQAIEQIVESRVQQRLNPLQQQFQQQTGYLHDQVDYNQFQLKYGQNSRFQPYLEQVEQIRRDAQMKGQWISREDALRFAYFEETGKKAEAPAPKAQEPKFDQYLGQFVDANGKVVPPPGAPQASLDPEEQALMNGQQQGQPQQQPAPQPMQMQPGQQPMQMQPNQFQMQPQQQMAQPQQQFQLPNAQPLPAAPAAPGSGQHIQLDVMSSDQALDAFAQKYGDIPL